PSPATLRRTLATLDSGALEAALAALARTLAATSPPAAPPSVPAELPALAADGKLVRGAQVHGGQSLLVGLVSHHSGLVCDQAAADKGAEQRLVPAVLARTDLRGKLVTVDA